MALLRSTARLATRATCQDNVADQTFLKRRSDGAVQAGCAHARQRSFLRPMRRKCSPRRHQSNGKRYKQNETRCLSFRFAELAFEFRMSGLRRNCCQPKSIVGCPLELDQVAGGSQLPAQL